MNPFHSSLTVFRMVAWGALMASLTGPAHAHETASGDSDDVRPGSRLGASAALSAVHASSDWPAPRWPGVLGSGQTARDRNGVRLEHATFSGTTVWSDASARLWDARLAIGLHDRDPAHLETAALGARHTLEDGVLRWSVGRQWLPMGDVFERAGHLDVLAQPPLVKRAVMDEGWIDDGLNLRWRAKDHDAFWRQVDVGLWRARQFPGGGAPRATPTLHAATEAGDWTLDGFAAWLAPKGRGSYAVSTNGAHTHAQPDCSRSLQGVVCFDGHAVVTGLSARWRDPLEVWSLDMAALWQREQGTLYGTAGSGDYHGDTQGGWADLGWRLTEDWRLLTRLERLRTSHTLTGPGATALAQTAGLSPNRPAHRLSVASIHDLAPRWQWSVEAGAERGTVPTNRWIGLRLVWREPALWARADRP